MRQRAEAAGGSLELLATSGGGTTVQAVVPTRVGYLEASRDLAPTAGVDVRAPLDHILESVTDAFVALDVDWHYVYVNRRAAEMFGRTPDELIGRHIWTEFPEGVGQTFYHAYYRAAAEQRTIELEDYYPPWDRWFVNRIYPSPRGLTIFFHDVTEAHRQARRLDERELGSALLSELLATLSVTVDLPDALHAAAEGIAGLDGVRGVSLSAGGVDVCHGELPDESAQRHRVFVGDVEAGAVTIAWQGVDDDWARYLGSAVARTIATRLAPGNPLTPRPVGSA